MGDPRGIGPEVVARALRRLPTDVRVTVVGAADVLRHAGAELDAPGVTVLDLDNFPVAELDPREPDAATGRASLDYIERAVQLVQHGQADALVTGPINKESIAAAGSPHPGHTEMLAALCGGATPVMLMACPTLSVALVTTHAALRDVPQMISIEKIVEVARILHNALRRSFGMTAPRIAVCGLNPHAGDGGRFGDEEARIIAPAIAQLADLGITGPHPADSVFAHAVAGGYDAVIAQYHDQGLIPVKLAGLDQVINITLGLPIIRTSVGHGTAFDIAGTGQASEASLLHAIDAAAEMVRSHSVS